MPKFIPEADGTPVFPFTVYFGDMTAYQTFCKVNNIMGVCQGVPTYINPYVHFTQDDSFLQLDLDYFEIVIGPDPKPPEPWAVRKYGAKDIDRAAYAKAKAILQAIVDQREKNND